MVDQDEVFLVRVRELVRMAEMALEEAEQYADRIESPELRDKAYIALDLL